LLGVDAYAAFSAGGAVVRASARVSSADIFVAFV
jgi:hypothetical protein